MQPADLLQAIEKALSIPVKELGGTLLVCEDELAALVRLEQSPANGWLCLLLMTGGQPNGRRGGTHDQETVTLTLYLGKNVGLPINPSAGLYVESASGLPLLTRVFQVRGLIQSLVFVEPYELDAEQWIFSDQVDNAGCVFTGWRILGPDDSPEKTHAARLTFTLTVAFDGPAGDVIPVSITPSTPPESTPDP